MTGILWKAITVSILRGFSIMCCRHFIALCGSPLSSNAVWFYHDALRLLHFFFFVLWLCCNVVRSLCDLVSSLSSLASLAIPSSSTKSYSK